MRHRHMSVTTTLGGPCHKVSLDIPAKSSLVTISWLLLLIPLRTLHQGLSKTIPTYTTKRINQYYAQTNSVILFF